nr:hypothetical protein GCM10020185_76220 [Pseudomonas brassicacearum subsp. brassicacearum]
MQRVGKLDGRRRGAIIHLTVHDLPGVVLDLHQQLLGIAAGQVANLKVKAALTRNDIASDTAIDPADLDGGVRDIKPAIQRPL